MLDIESFTYLNRALESTISPHVILATNRGLATIRGTESDSLVPGEGMLSPHGLPVDLLDRCMIVRTLPYSREEIKTVLGIRAKVEGLTVDPEAADWLADEGARTSLRWVGVHGRGLRAWADEQETHRFALQLLTPASILSSVQGRTSITLEDVKETDSLFLDARASAKQLGGYFAGGATAGRSEYMQ